MKTKLTISLQIIFTLIWLISCKPSPEVFTKTDMKKIVDGQNELMGICFMESNLEKLAGMYADSAKLSPNGYRFVIGRDSIRAFWAEDFKSSKVLDMKTQVLTVDGTRDVIYETGIATSLILIKPSDTILARVKYINVWRKQADETYKLDIDFWNKDGK